jgi:predicted aspartyl protease
MNRLVPAFFAFALTCLFPAVASAETAILYIEDKSDAYGKLYPGAVSWGTTNVVNNAGKVVGVEARANVRVPGIAATVIFRPNRDKGFLASHTIEIKFFPSTSFGQTIEGVPNILLKGTETAKGTPLKSFAVRTGSNNFLIGLSSAELKTNLELLNKNDWFDIPMFSNTGRRSILAFEKGAPGRQALHAALERSTAPLESATAGIPNPISKGVVPLKEDGGTFVVPVLINNAITLDFVVDSGAADVSIPADVVLTLTRTGTINNADFIGSATYILADGSKVPSKRFRIRSLKLGNTVIENVVGSIAPVEGSLLLGQSFLGRFKSWSIDNSTHALILNE